MGLSMAGRTEKSGSESQLSMLVELELDRENGLKEAVLVDMS